MSAYRRLFRNLVTCLGWRLPALIALMALVGLTEGSAMALLLPLLSRVGTGFTSNQGPAIALLEHGLAAVGATGPLAILVVIIAVAAIQTVLFLALHWWNSRLAKGFQHQRQEELFRAFLRARWSFVARKKLGELTNAIVTETNRSAVAFSFGLSILSTAVVILIYVAISLLIAWPVVVSLMTFAVLAALTMVPIYKRSSAVGQTLAPINAELQSVIGEQLASIKIVKATVSEDRALAFVDGVLRKLESLNTLAIFFPGMVRGIFEFLAIAGVSVIFVLGDKALGVALGDAVVVLALFARLFPRLTTLQANVHYLNANVHAIETIDRLQTAAEAEAERQRPAAKRLAVELPATLIVQDLDVAFDDRKVLDGISLRLDIPGLLAVVGTSGAGKSTLVHALLGLVESSAGSIRLASYDLASTPLSAWRRAIGYVPQETILFHASIRDNLTMVNAAASETEIRIAARRAHALDFIDSLPDGFDAIIGDQGVKLSGGQRQRLGIARALLMNPVLLVMDEAMSALDTESEAELLRTLDGLRKKMGILIVAHRLAAVRSADSICVIEAGRVVESGTWNELMARGTRFYSLAEAQSIAIDRPLPVF